MRNKFGLLFSLALVALFAGALVGAQGFRSQARLFPIVIAVAGLALALVQLGQEIRRQTSPAGSAERVDEAGPEDAQEQADQLPARDQRRRTVAILGWLLAYVLAIWLLGFPLAVPILVGAYLKLGTRESWFSSAVFALACGAFFYGVFVRLIRIPFEDGALFALLQG